MRADCSAVKVLYQTLVVQNREYSDHHPVEVLGWIPPHPVEKIYSIYSDVNGEGTHLNIVY